MVEDDSRARSYKGCQEARGRLPLEGRGRRSRASFCVRGTRETVLGRSEKQIRRRTYHTALRLAHTKCSQTILMIKSKDSGAGGPGFTCLVPLLPHDLDLGFPCQRDHLMEGLRVK